MPSICIGGLLEVRPQDFIFAGILFMESPDLEPSQDLTTYGKGNVAGLPLFGSW